MIHNKIHSTKSERRKSKLRARVKDRKTKRLNAEREKTKGFG